MILHSFLQCFVLLEYENIVEFLYTKSNFSVSAVVIAPKAGAVVVAAVTAVVALVQLGVGYREHYVALVAVVVVVEEEVLDCWLSVPVAVVVVVEQMMRVVVVAVAC